MIKIKFRLAFQKELMALVAEMGRLPSIEPLPCRILLIRHYLVSPQQFQEKLELRWLNAFKNRNP